MCACIEAASLKQRERTPLVKPRTIEIQGEMVGYDCILFWDIFPILSPMCHQYFHFPSWQKHCVMTHAQSLELQHWPLLCNYHSVLMQKHPNMREGINHFLCFVDRTNVITTQRITSMQVSGMQRAYFLYNFVIWKKLKPLHFSGINNDLFQMCPNILSMFK